MVSRPLRPAIATKRAGCRAAPVLPPGVVRFPAPPTLPSLPVALNTALCTDSVPPCGVPCRQPNQSVCPTGSASSSQEGPFPYFPSYSSAPEASTREQEREREKENTPPPFTPQHPPPLRSYVMPYFKQPPDSDGDFRPDLKKVFSGMGEHERGRGSFYKKRPFPSRHSPAPQPLHNKKAGQSSAPAFTGKTKERGYVTSFRRCA